MSKPNNYIVARPVSIQNDYNSFEKEEGAVEKASLLVHSDAEEYGIYKLVKIAKPETPPVKIEDVN